MVRQAHHDDGNVILSLSKDPLTLDLSLVGEREIKRLCFYRERKIKSLSVNKIYFLLVLWYRFSRMTPYVNGRNHGQYTVLGSLGCVLGQGGAVDPSAGT
jgi:hypothetical protein